MLYLTQKGTNAREIFPPFQTIASFRSNRNVQNTESVEEFDISVIVQLALVGYEANTGPYCKLRVLVFFPFELWPKRETYLYCVSHGFWNDFYSCGIWRDSKAKRVNLLIRVNYVSITLAKAISRKLTQYGRKYQTLFRFAPVKISRKNGTFWETGFPRKGNRDFYEGLRNETYRVFEQMDSAPVWFWSDYLVIGRNFWQTLVSWKFCVQK